MKPNQATDQRPNDAISLRYAVIYAMLAMAFIIGLSLAAIRYA